MTTPERNVVLVEAPVIFGATCDTDLPPIMHRDVEVDTLLIPDYLVPGKSRSFWTGIQNRIDRRLNGEEGELLQSLQLKADRDHAMGHTIDRSRFLASLDEDMSHQEVVQAFGLYTTLVRPGGPVNSAGETATAPVVHAEVRSDITALLAKAESLYGATPDDEKAEFVDELAANFTATTSSGVWGPQGFEKRTKTNPSMYVARNALLDIVSHPDSLLDPAVVMGVRVLRKVAETQRDTRTTSLQQLTEFFLTAPDTLVRNPELLFFVDEQISGESKLTLTEASRLIGRFTNELFLRVKDVADAESYPARLSQAYLAIADKLVAENPVSHAPTPVSQGGDHFVPTALVNLARLVAKGDPSAPIELSQSKRSHANHFSVAFDYLLPYLDLGKLWPELDPKTVVTIEKGFSKVAHLADEISK